MICLPASTRLFAAFSKLMLSTSIALALWACTGDATSPSHRPAKSPPKAQAPAQTSQTIPNPVANEAWHPGPMSMDTPKVDLTQAQKVWQKAQNAHDARLARNCAHDGKQVYRIIPEQSQLGYVAYKNGSNPVPGSFGQIAGHALIAGAQAPGEVILNPASLDSGLDMRTQRLLKLFFEIENESLAQLRFQTTTIEGQLPTTIDQQANITLHGTLQMHGKTLPLALPFAAKATQANRWQLTLRPTASLLKLASFDLIAPLKALMLLCNHKSMGDAVQLKLDVTLAKGCAAS